MGKLAKESGRQEGGAPRTGIRRPEEVTVGEFMSRHVLTVYSSSSVRKAIGVMGEKNVGSLVVLDNSGPEGVFTERDLLSKVLAKGKDRDNTLVMEVLSPLYVSTESTATLPEAARLMMERKSRLMVFEGGDLAGIVTATDLVTCIAGLDESFSLDSVVTRRIVMELPETPLTTVVEDMDRKRVGSVLVGETQEKAYGIFTERDLLVKVLLKRLSLEFLVGELATVPLVTAKLGIDGVEAARLMVARRIKRLPLTLGGQVAGIVTARDIVEAFASVHPA